VSFSPDGSSLVSVGADRKINLYDGKTGEFSRQIGADEHKGSIFAVSWARDSKRFVTSSADQTVKIWDAEAGKCIQTWRMGEEGAISVPDHQVGVVWPAGRSDGLIISLNLAGNLTYLHKGTPKPQNVVQGHQKSITAMDVAPETKTLWTGSSEGCTCIWDTATGVASTPDGSPHTNYISAISASPSPAAIYSVGWDDTLRSASPSAKTFTGISAKTDGQPKSVAVIGAHAIVVTNKGIEVFHSGKKIYTQPTKFSPLALAAMETLLAVAGDDSTLHISSLSLSASSATLTSKKEIPLSGGTITTLSFSPSASLLAAGFSNGQITVYDTASWEPSITRWSAHTSRVNSIRWNEEGTNAVSGGLDGSVYVWSVKKPGMRVRAEACREGVNGVCWLGEGRVASVGGDGSVKVWGVEGLV